MVDTNMGLLAFLPSFELQRSEKGIGLGRNLSVGCGNKEEGWVYDG